MFKKIYFLALFGAFTSPAFAFSSSTIANATTFSPLLVNSKNVSSLGMSAASDGTILFKSGKSLPLSGGGSLPIDVTGSLSRPSTAGAIGKFALKAFPLAATAYALYDLAKEMGFEFETASGSGIISKFEAEGCTVEPCFEYKANHFNYPSWYSTSNGACQAAISVHEGYQFTRTDGSTCFYRYLGGGEGVFITLLRRSIPPVTPFKRIYSPQEFADEIARKSGWPTSTALPRALEEAIKSGEQVTTEVPTVTGPSTVPGPRTVTTDHIKNETTTTTTTNTQNYVGPTVTTNQTQTSITVNNNTNQVTNQITTVTTPISDSPQKKDDPAPFEMPCGIAGKSPCNVKVDESNMPQANPNPYDQAGDHLDSLKLSTKTAIDSVKNDVFLPQWSWSFQLPSGCSPLPLQGYGFSLDICEFRPVIHDLMSMIWVVAGIFGLLGLARSAFES